MPKISMVFFVTPSTSSCSPVQVADARTSASRPSVFRRTQFVSDHAGYLNELFSGLALTRRGVARQLLEHYANYPIGSCFEEYIVSIVSPSPEELHAYQDEELADEELLTDELRRYPTFAPASSSAGAL